MSYSEHSCGRRSDVWSTLLAWLPKVTTTSFQYNLPCCKKSINLILLATVFFYLSFSHYRHSFSRIPLALLISLWLVTSCLCWQCYFIFLPSAFWCSPRLHHFMSYSYYVITLLMNAIFFHSPLTLNCSCMQMTSFPSFILTLFQSFSSSDWSWCYHFLVFF